ncbi:MAG TPA: hypothetical protein VEO75_02470, partial [Nitrososphaerales archaeon]|nr:hypothetical protein [Nitrososphaerales archaeon]
DVIAFLLGPDARYVNGHDLVVDGGVKPGTFSAVCPACPKSREAERGGPTRGNSSTRGYPSVLVTHQ